MLRMSEAKYRQIVENVTEGILVADEGWRTSFVNKRMAEMLGYAPEEMLGHQVIDFMDEGDKAITVRNEMIFDEKGTGERDLTFLRKDGSKLHAHLVASKVAQSGNMKGGVAFISDITERDRMEEALKEREHFLERVLYTHPSGIMVYDIPSNRVVYINNWVSKATGLTSEQFTGTSNIVNLLVHPDDQRTMAETMNTVVNGKDDEVHGADIRVRASLGDWIWVHFNATPFMRDRDGKVVQTITGLKDISDRKRAEDELKKVSSKLDLMNSITRHDLNNQLIIIQGNLELILRQVKDPGLLSCLERVKRSTKTCRTSWSSPATIKRWGPPLRNGRGSPRSCKTLPGTRTSNIWNLEAVRSIFRSMQTLCWTRSSTT